jgi:hypothetical protein
MNNIRNEMYKNGKAKFIEIYQNTFFLFYENESRFQLGSNFK